MEKNSCGFFFTFFFWNWTRGFFSLRWGLRFDKRTRRNSNGMQGAKKETRLCRMYNNDNNHNGNNNNNNKGIDITHFRIGDKWKVIIRWKHPALTFLFQHSTVSLAKKKTQQKKSSCCLSVRLTGCWCFINTVISSFRQQAETPAEMFFLSCTQHHGVTVPLN